MLEQDVPLSEALKIFFNGLQAKTGININRDTVLGHSAFWRGMNLVASSIARLPINCYKYTSDGGREVDDTHPGHKFIHRPNDVVGKFQCFRTLIHHALQHGNGYLWVRRDPVTNEPYEGIVLDAQMTIPIRTNGKLYYLTRATTSVIVVEPSYELGQLMTILPENILHVRGLSYDGLVGYSVLDILRDCLGMGIALQQYGSTYFRNNAAPNVIIEVPGKFKDQEEVEHFLKGWKANHEGLDNAHKVSILQNGAKVSKWQVDNEQGQFLASKEFDLKTVAHIIGIPPHKLGANNAGGYNSLEAENKAFLQDLEPWLHTIEEELNNKLLTESEKRRSSRYFEFVRSALERADTKTETDVLIAQLNNGLLTLDQTLAIRNMPGTGDKSGGLHRMPSNLIFSEFVQDPKDSKAQVNEDPQDDDESQNESGNDDKDTEDDLTRQLTHDVGRLVTRLEKAFLAKRGDADYSPGDLIVDHEAIIAESLPTIKKERISAWLDGLGQELEAATRDQVEKVFRGQDPKRIVWNLRNEK